MSRHIKVTVVLFFATIIAFALGMAATLPAAAAPTAAPLAQACELPPPVDGTAVPTFVMPGQTITFTVFNFRAGEAVSFWFTRPDGAVAGTASPLCCAPSSGRLEFPPLQIPQSYSQYPGAWAFTVQGNDSQHISIVYFCVSNQPQPTATPIPPTNTAVPPTATSVPATATSVPATATTEATAQPSATAAVTAEVTVQPTTEATAQPTSPPAATPEATVAPPEVTVLPVPTPEVIGMPRTGESLPILALVMILVSIVLLGAGVATRKRVQDSAE